MEDLPNPYQKDEFEMIMLTGFLIGAMLLALILKYLN